MKRTLRWGLLLLPMVALGAALFGALWRINHPPPTALDTSLRALMLSNGNAELRSNVSPHILPLNEPEREEIIANFWTNADDVHFFSGDTSCLFFALGSGTLIVGDKPSEDLYMGLGEHGETLCCSLHPATSHFLREWVNAHPEITRQLNFQLKSPTSHEEEDGH